MNMFNEIQILISGMLCGLILFQSIFVAPTVFKELAEDQRPIILRSLFPKLFKSITLLGFIFLILSSKTGSGYLIGSFTLLSGIICHAMIGATNEARDKGNVRLFKILHSVSVISTLIILLLCISQIFLIVRPTEEIL